MSPRKYEFHTPACSGETNPNRNWRLPPVSAPLNRVGLFGIRLPPASECWPELGADSHSVLRRTRARRRYGFRTLACSGETDPNGSWCFPPVSAPSRRSWALRYSSSSYYRILAGEERGFAPCPPSNDDSSEDRISTSHQLRKNKP